MQHEQITIRGICKILYACREKYEEEESEESQMAFLEKIRKESNFVYTCGRLKQIYALEDEIFYTKPIDIVIDILVF